MLDAYRLTSVAIKLPPLREKIQLLGLKAPADKDGADEGSAQENSPARPRQASCAAVRSNSS